MPIQNVSANVLKRIFFFKKCVFVFFAAKCTEVSSKVSIWHTGFRKGLTTNRWQAVTRLNDDTDYRHIAYMCIQIKPIKAWWRFNESPGFNKLSKGQVLSRVDE